MAHDVFISYSSQDRRIAELVLAKLQEAEIPCWVDYKYRLAGKPYAENLLEAITESKVMVLVFSARCNDSPFITREVERAIHKGITVITFRIEDVMPEGQMEFFLSSVNWLDALPPLVEDHLEKLVEMVRVAIDFKKSAASEAVDPQSGTIPKAMARPLEQAIDPIYQATQSSPQPVPPQAEQGRASLASGADIRDLQGRAEQGDTSAQVDLGLAYDKGEGVPQDYKEAVKWFRKAAEQGDAYGQNNLGFMYANGQGVPQDYKEAMKWFRKAAEQGHTLGQHNLAVMYRNGQGVPQDYKEAVKWFRKAAEQGDRDAQYNLGWMYHQGVGVEENRDEAKKWYKKAAGQGQDNAKKALELMD